LDEELFPGATVLKSALIISYFRRIMMGSPSYLSNGFTIIYVSS
jgi:hypothetical protein